MKKKDKNKRKRRIFNKYHSVNRSKKKKARRKYIYKPISRKRKISKSKNDFTNTKLTVAQRGHQKTQVCYNCRKVFDAKDITKEHIPAKNLFEGYDEKYKVNRITVPACSECNGKYSPTDEEFRNMIGVIAKRKENQKITEKAAKSCNRGQSRKQRLFIDDTGKVSGVSFGQSIIDDFHKKNFKGLFYHQYKTVLPDNYELFVNVDENDWSDSTLGILGYLKNLFTEKYSGHPDILSYVIQPFRLNISNPTKKDLLPQKDENIFVAYLNYNREHTALVFAVRKEYLEKIKNKKTSK